MNKITYMLIATALMSLFSAKAQVSIVNIQLAPYNVTPDAMLAASVTNTGDAQAVQMISRLYNFNAELVLTVKSSVFQLKPGLNAPFDGSRAVSSVEYSTGKQGEYIKTTHGLPSGTFKICVDLILTSSMETGDEFCEEIESDFNQYLYLVFPADKDTLESTSPLLSWTHSEPFSVLTQGEYYRMVVSELKKNQNPEEAVSINSPLMVKNYLTTHNLQYPYDAPELKEGKLYAWQVQKLSNGVITNKTEAWQFAIRKRIADKELKYVALKQTVGADFYTSYTGKIYFKFTEEYNSSGNIIAYITADNGKEIPIVIDKDKENSKTEGISKIKVMGDNRFVLDLDKENLKPGFYTMKIKNEKKEIFYLKFYLSR